VKLAKVDLPYLWTPVIKGNSYAYYRRGAKAVRLPKLDTPAFLPAYHAAHEAAEAQARPGATGALGVHLAGSMAALVVAYRSSSEWRELAPATREDYNKALNPLMERYGRLPVATMPRQFVFTLRESYASMPAFTKHKIAQPILDEQGKQVIRPTPRRANRMVNVLRLLLSWAGDRGGWFKGENRALRPGRLRTGPGYATWSPEAISAFMASEQVPAGIKLAAMLGLCTGQRKQDCLAMTRASRAGGIIEVTPEKTKHSSGVKLRIPEHPDLTRLLDAGPQTGEALLTRPDGKPWKEDHFNHAFAKAVKDAGLTGLSFHGLRKTASAWLAESGATDAEIDSILGHVDPKMTRLYRRHADQGVRAASAMGKLALRRIGEQQKNAE
jgi:integrase